MDKDFRELLSAFNAHNVKYLIVGGYAVSFHSDPRTTKDLDLFIQPSPENAKAVFLALKDYGAPLDGISAGDFSSPGSVFQIGVAPMRVDILQSIDGVDFEDAWNRRVRARVATNDSLEGNYISAEDLMSNKLASGRPRDLVDADEIRSSLQSNRSAKGISNT